MTDLKEAAKRVFLETLKAIEPGLVIGQKFGVSGEALMLGGEEIPLDSFNEVVLVGMGKASLKMGAAIEKLLGDTIKRGILVTDRRSSTRVRSEVLVGGHPLPDANSLIAGERIVDLVESCSEQALIIFLISGGGSSLVELPQSPSISLEDLRAANQVLIGCGAAISEINIIRKRLSRIKGGRLGRLAKKSKCIGLYISDVNPGDLRSISSNPLLPERTGDEELLDVITKFSLTDKLPSSVVRVLQYGSASDFDADRDSPESLPLAMLLLDNSSALQAAAEVAGSRGFRVEVDVDSIEGDYRTVANYLVDRLVTLRTSFPSERVCVISGGEVSCPVHGDGIGGRNQEFVLYSAARLASLGLREGAIVLSCGTDGVDGNSKAAGAVADSELVLEAARQGADASIFISNNDSYSFFKKAGGLIVTGPSGNNVRDLRILMAQ